jgi:acyl-CoA synthetase (NDP forming)
MEKAGLHVPHLSSEVQAELKQSLPLAGSIFSNPVDTPNLASPEAMLAAISVVGKVPDIHMVIYHLGFHPISRWAPGRFSSAAFLKPVIDALVETHQMSGKPVLLALCPAPELGGMKEFLATQEAFVEAGFPVFNSLRQAARAMARVVAWNQE